MTTTQDTPPETTEAATRHVINTIITAIGSNDWDLLASVVSPSIIYWRPGTRDRVDGVEGYIDQWRSINEIPARMKYTPHSIIIDGDTGVVEATAEVELPKNETARSSIVSFMRVESGKLIEEREYIVEQG